MHVIAGDHTDDVEVFLLKKFLVTGIDVYFGQSRIPIRSILRNRVFAEITHRNQFGVSNIVIRRHVRMRHGHTPTGGGPRSHGPLTDPR